MSFINCNQLCEIPANSAKEISKWINEESVLTEFDLVELFWNFTDEVIRKNNLDIEPHMTSKVMLYRDTQEEVEFLNSIGVDEFRIVPILTEEHLRLFIEYRMDGKLGVKPFDNGYEFYILNNESKEISTTVTITIADEDDKKYIDALWELACRAASI